MWTGNSLGPTYLSDLLSSYGCDTTRLAVPVTQRVVGDGAFSFLGTKLWNDLPIFIRHACLFLILFVTVFWYGS